MDVEYPVNILYLQHTVKWEDVPFKLVVQENLDNETSSWGVTYKNSIDAKIGETYRNKLRRP